MDAIAAKQADANLELDVDFRMTIVTGNIKDAMKAGNKDVVSEGEVPIKYNSGDLWNLDPRGINVIPGYNTRLKNDKYRERVKNLTKSMLKIGFKKDSPLSVIVLDEGSGKQSIAVKRGHQRLEAALEAIRLGADFKTIPCIIVKDDASEEDMTADLVVSNNGADLSPYETAIVCKRMTRWHPDDHNEIAERLGLSVQQVGDSLSLINGPVEIANYVRDEVISFTLAIEMLKEHGVKALGVIEQSLARSQAAGKNKLTSRFTPGKTVQKAVKRAASDMKDAITDIKKDQAFSLLTVENQEKLEAILKKFQEAEDAEAKLLAGKEETQSELNLKQAEV